MRAAKGAVYDRGYRPYDGPRGGRVAAVTALFKASVRRAIGLRRPWRQKVLPFGLLAIAAIPAAINVGIGYATRNSPLEGFSFFTYREYVGVSSSLLLFVAVSAPDVLCPDRRQRGRAGEPLSERLRPELLEPEREPPQPVAVGHEHVNLPPGLGIGRVQQGRQESRRIRRELLRAAPVHHRARAREQGRVWDELAYEEPDWPAGAFNRVPCPVRLAQPVAASRPPSTAAASPPRRANRCQSRGRGSGSSSVPVSPTATAITPAANSNPGE